MRFFALFFSCWCLLSSVAVSQTSSQSDTAKTPSTVPEAEQFIKNAEAKLDDLTTRQGRASWVQSNFITDDTEILSAEANEALIGATTDLAKQATRYDNLKMPGELARKMLLLKLSAAVPAPAPSDPKELAEMTRIGTSLEADYGKRQVLPEDRQACRRVPRHHRHRTASWPTVPIRRRLKDLWVGWRSIRRRCATVTRAGWSWATRALARWASATWARCGARATT